jgi:hypothetical protein
VFVKEPWYPRPAADYRETCDCYHCCTALGRTPTSSQAADYRESLRLIARMGAGWLTQPEK